MIALCLSAGALSATLFTHSFTLSWMHSVEKIQWEEDWSVKRDSLLLTSARVRGSGAGMEPPLGSIFRDGAWHYTPHVPPLTELQLAHSPYTKEYELCIDFTCKPISVYLPNLSENTIITLEACER